MTSESAKSWILKTLEFCGMFDPDLTRVGQAFVAHCMLEVFFDEENKQ